MSQTRYVHPTEGRYATFAAAYADAQAGDTILLSPAYVGTEFRLNLTKLVHIKGDTDAPNTTRCTLARGINLSGLVNLGATTHVFLEGISIADGNYAEIPIVFGSEIYQTVNWINGPTLHFNRCCFGYDEATFSASRYEGALTNAGGKILLSNCEFNYQHTGTQGRFLIGTSSPPAYVITATCTGPGTFAAADIANCLVADTVATATPGYGANAGEWFYEQWRGTSYRLSGQITNLPPGYVASQYRIRLYRELPDGTRELTPIMQTTPSGETGLFEFRYLPRFRNDGQPQRYRIDWEAPDGLAPGCHGWYDPEPEAQE